MRSCEVKIVKLNEKKKEFIESKQKGMFHQWGINFVEFESGPANYTVGIVELEDGSIVEVSPVHVKFIG